MNNRHQRTLQAVFETPTHSDMEWQKVESLLNTVGGTIANGRGARRRLTLNGVVGIIQLSLHEPHPTGTSLCKCDVENLRDFFEKAGITLDTINGSN